MKAFNYLPYSEFKRILDENLYPQTQLKLLTSMALLNRLACAQKAGVATHESGSAEMELLIWMYNTARINQEQSLPKTTLVVDLETRDPALHALRFAFGRQANLFDDTAATNRDQTSDWLTLAPGSAIPHGIGLTMGRTLHGMPGNTIVLTDNSSRWQSQLCNPLVTIMQKELKSLHVIVRLDKQETLDWDSLQHQIIAFGWRIKFCDTLHELDKAINVQATEADSPTVHICQFDADVNHLDLYLSPGIGVGEFPSTTDVSDQFEAIADALDIEFSRLGLAGLNYQTCELTETTVISPAPENLIEAVGDSLLQLAAEHSDVILLDSAHKSNYHCRRFKQLYPDRYLKDSSFRDTINTAAGLSEEGMLPVICTTSAQQHDLDRLPNDSRVIVLALDAGLSAGMNGTGNPYLSDIALYSARTDCEIIHPCCADEVYSALTYALEQTKRSVLIRISSGKIVNSITLPLNYGFKHGTGAIARKGKDALLFAYGPIMLQTALQAAEMLAMHDFDAAVVNLPWVNRIDLRWLRPLISSYEQIHVIDDHTSMGGLGNHLLHLCTEQKLLQNRRFRIHGANGSDTILTGEALLSHHKLDSESLAAEILKSAGEQRLSKRAQEAARKLRVKLDKQKTEEETSSILEVGLNILNSL